MAFTARIDSITRNNDFISVGVTYADGATGFSASKTFDFPDDGTTTQAVAVAQITAVGQKYKADLATNNALLAKVGAVLII